MYLNYENIVNSFFKSTSLNSSDMEYIKNIIEEDNGQSYQEIAKFVADKRGVKEEDVYQFLHENQDWVIKGINKEKIQ